MPELDDVDKIILKRLQEDARRSFKEIAKEAGVSEATIFVRVGKLQKAGVIRGFRAVIDPESIGKKTAAIILLRANPKMYAKVLEELAGIENISEIYDVTGAYYSILKVRAKNTEDLAQTIDRIGAIEGITGTETAVVLRTIKEESLIRV